MTCTGISELNSIISNLQTFFAIWRKFKITRRFHFSPLGEKIKHIKDLVSVHSIKGQECYLS